mgnify:CR=1 FL=1
MRKSITFISDYFIEDCFGGAEIVDKEIIEGLEENGYEVTRIRCAALTPQTLIDIANRKNKIIIGNFVTINSQAMEFIATKCQYSIMEHDHKYVQSRDVTNFKDFVVPPNMLINRKFYQNADYVYCQASSHAKAVTLNLGLKNVVNLSTSIWSDKDLAILEENCTKPKNGKTMVLGSNNPIKNTELARQVCEDNGIDYDIVGPLPYPELMSKMAEYSEVLFLPAFFESFNRFIAEAKMLGCRIRTSNKNACTSEPWFKELSGLELVNFIKDSKSKFIDNFINPPKLYEYEQPLVSIITSKFKGDEHIEAFLENITSQSVFNSCELIIVDPTPGPPCEIILDQMRIHDNIIYKKIENDPGIYGCWNIAIGLSHGKYITNANLDDRRADTHIAHHVRFLEHNEDIDLAYSEVFLTEKDFESYYANSSQGMVYPTSGFSNENMQRCLPGCMPVWRAKIHDNDVMFDASLKSAGDWEMWLRAVGNGSKFGKLPGIYGMYYMNPTGLSTNPETLKEKQIEEKSVFDKYKHIFTKS